MYNLISCDKGETLRGRNKALHIVFVADAVSLPKGMAATQRLLNLAKGLNKNQLTTEVVLVRPTEALLNPMNNSICGYVDNIKYSYLNGSPYYAKTSAGRRLQEVHGLIRCLRYLGTLKKVHEKILIITYSRHLLTILSLKIISLVLKTHLIAEMCEWPLAIPTKDKFTRIRKNLFCKIVPHLIDGALPISEYIREQIHTENPGLPMLKVPILINADEATTIEIESKINFPYLVFSGGIQYYKTVKLILESFKIISDNDQEILLIITGISQENIPDWVKINIEKLCLKDKVIFAGFLNREELFAFYRNASALLIPLHDDLQSRSRFPTKIGEYLLSGSPIVTTNYGEVPRYLEDGVTAFIAHSDSVSAFSDCITRAIKSNFLSLEIGLQGRELALKEFDSAIHGQRIKSWIHSVFLKTSYNHNISFL